MTRDRNTPTSRHVIEVVAPAMDMVRLETLLAAAFGASSVKLRTAISLGDGGEPVFGKLSKVGTRIMALLADGRPWRAKHVIERVAEGLKPATVRHELTVLWDEGRIEKPRSGIWILAGMPTPSEDDIPPLRSERVGGPAVKKVLARLSNPTTSMELVEELGVTRQRVDQILKGLLEDGKVTRVAEPGMQGRWVWLRADLNVRSAMRHHAPALPDGRARVLNVLVPDAFHWIGQVAEATGQVVMAVRKQVEELETRGLAVSFRLGQKRYVGITPRGLDHPSRSVERRAQVADMSKAFGGKRIAFIEALAVLGEAKTIDITAALAGVEQAGSGLMSGQQIAALTKSDFAEQVSSASGTHPGYRLTEAGRLAAALIARNRIPPDRETLEERIRSFRARRTERLRSQGSERFGLVGSPAQSAIVHALGEGPLSTSILRKAIAAHVRNTKSVHLMLRSLQRRGVIRSAGKDGQVKTWELAESS